MDRPMKRQGIPGEESDANGTQGEIGQVLFDKQMVVQSMETLILERQDELSHLNDQKMQVLNEITQAQVERDRIRRSMTEESSIQRQTLALEISHERTSHSQQTEHLARLERQFEARDRELTQRELDQNEAIKLHEKVQARSLEIERMRAQIQQELALAKEKTAEWELKIASLQSMQADVKFQQQSLQQRNDSFINSEADLDRRIKALSVREQVLEKASSMIEPKLIELNEIEKGLETRKQELTKQADKLKELQAQIAEAQDKFELERKNMDSRMSQVVQEEALMRQRKLVLISEESQAKPKEQVA